MSQDNTLVEHQLAALQERFDDFVEALPEALVEFAFDGLRVVRMNLVARIVLGYTDDDVREGISIRQLVDAATFDYFGAMLRDLTAPSLESGEPYSRRMEQNIYETRLRRKDGTWFPADIQGSVVLDENGRPVGAQVMGRDITQRKEAEAERERLLVELQAALADVKRLEGLLPLCAWCRRVRDDDGYWRELEAYVLSHSNASFSHGICPRCADRMTESRRLRDAAP